MTEFPRIVELELADYAIHLWRLDMSQLQLESTYSGRWLTDDERRRADRFGRMEDSRRFIVVRSTLRELLGKYLHRHPAEIEFSVGAHGKPRLAGTNENEGLVFNVSHSGGMALLAVTRNRSLGVDVECIRADRNLVGLGRRALTPAEQQLWRGMEPDLQIRRFFQWWVCKEALGKAIGLGMQVGFQCCAIDPNVPTVLQLPEAFGSPSEWHLAYVDCGEGMSACVCYRGSSAVLFVDDLYVGDPMLLKFPENG